MGLFSIIGFIFSDLGSYFEKMYLKTKCNFQKVNFRTAQKNSENSQVQMVADSKQQQLCT